MCMCSAFAPAQCGNSVANDKHFREIEKRASRVEEMSWSYVIGRCVGVGLKTSSTGWSLFNGGSRTQYRCQICQCRRTFTTSGQGDYPRSKASATWCFSNWTYIALSLWPCPAECSNFKRARDALLIGALWLARYRHRHGLLAVGGCSFEELTLHVIAGTIQATESAPATEHRSRLDTTGELVGGSL